MTDLGEALEIARKEVNAQKREVTRLNKLYSDKCNEVMELKRKYLALAASIQPMKVSLDKLTAEKSKWLRKQRREA